MQRQLRGEGKRKVSPPRVVTTIRDRTGAADADINASSTPASIIIILDFTV